MSKGKNLNTIYDEILQKLPEKYHEIVLGEHSIIKKLSELKNVNTREALEILASECSHSFPHKPNFFIMFARLSHDVQKLMATGKISIKTLVKIGNTQSLQLIGCLANIDSLLVILESHKAMDEGLEMICKMNVLDLQSFISQASTYMPFIKLMLNANLARIDEIALLIIKDPKKFTLLMDNFEYLLDSKLFPFTIENALMLLGLPEANRNTALKVIKNGFLGNLIDEDFRESGLEKLYNVNPDLVEDFIGSIISANVDNSKQEEFIAHHPIYSKFLVDNYLIKAAKKIEKIIELGEDGSEGREYRHITTMNISAKEYSTWEQYIASKSQANNSKEM
ncbi:MAG: hypothetical protein J0G32_07480 [Alphaproteobacteria bacterium]|nr:hypothetical protein [Alphaproteobacteria bacterium]OJV12167.1 MAG: hypothetical protein BGO27_05455 [Alphaproteobacteria bacterium 33-17]